MHVPPKSNFLYLSQLQQCMTAKHDLVSDESTTPSIQQPDMFLLEKAQT